VVKELSADERLEYQEVNEFARHDDTVMLAASSLLLPTLFAALAWAWQSKNDYVRIPMAVGSFIVWLYWGTIIQRRGQFAKLRYERAQELERKAGMDHHLRIDSADKGRTAWTRWTDQACRNDRGTGLCWRVAVTTYVGPLFGIRTRRDYRRRGGGDIPNLRFGQKQAPAGARHPRERGRKGSATSVAQLVSPQLLPALTVATVNRTPVHIKMIRPNDVAVATTGATARSS
jgi:hypothetical protein